MIAKPAVIQGSSRRASFAAGTPVYETPSSLRSRTALKPTKSASVSTCTDSIAGQRYTDSCRATLPAVPASHAKNDSSIHRVTNCHAPLLLLVRRSGARRSDEQLAPVRQCDVARVGGRRAVLRAIAVDDDRRADRQVVLVPAAAQQRVRRAAFDGPVGHLAALVLDVDVDPRVRVDPFGLGHRP